MHVLLLRPDPGSERFGLGRFFRVEPLGRARWRTQRLMRPEAHLREPVTGRPVSQA
jgi:hypothetical protein